MYCKYQSSVASEIIAIIPLSWPFSADKPKEWSHICFSTVVDGICFKHSFPDYIPTSPLLSKGHDKTVQDSPRLCQRRAASLSWDPQLRAAASENAPHSLPAERLLRASVSVGRTLVDNYIKILNSHIFLHSNWSYMFDLGVLTRWITVFLCKHIELKSAVDTDQDF